MFCLFCGHQTPEGMPYCDDDCETAHAEEDARQDAQEDAPGDDVGTLDTEDGQDAYDDEPDAQTLARLIRQH